MCNGVRGDRKREEKESKDATSPTFLRTMPQLRETIPKGR